jgi:hypothetical protein
MDSQNERTPSEQPGPAEAAPASKKRRFQIVKLEDRIAPSKGGRTNNPHPCGSSASSGGFQSSVGGGY